MEVCILRIILEKLANVKTVNVATQILTGSKGRFVLKC